MILKGVRMAPCTSKMVYCFTRFACAFVLFCIGSFGCARPGAAEEVGQKTVQEWFADRFGGHVFVNSVQPWVLQDGAESFERIVEVGVLDSLPFDPLGLPPLEPGPNGRRISTPAGSLDGDVCVVLLPTLREGQVVSCLVEAWSTLMNQIDVYSFELEIVGDSRAIVLRKERHVVSIGPIWGSEPDLSAH